MEDKGKKQGNKPDWTQGGRFSREESEQQKQATDEYRDPVCNMRCDPKNAQTVEYQGKKYYFCSDSCKRAFEQSPGQYIHFGPTPTTGEPLNG